MTHVVVVDPGRASSPQDRGRPGYAELGVPASGPLDRFLADQLNRLVGNDPDAAVLETAGGLRLRAGAGPLTIAATPGLGVHLLGPGEELAVEPIAGQLYGYAAVRGGFAIAPVLGSRSRESRSGLGPAPLAAGTRIPVGPEPAAPVMVDQGVPSARPPFLRLWPGPRGDWLSADALGALAATGWTVTADISRVGVRLAGPRLGRRREGELASEGMVAGAVQVPPDGQPVVMLADHPTTGGYPVVAVVEPADLAVLAQTPPGGVVRFRWVGGDRGGPTGVPDRVGGRPLG